MRLAAGQGRLVGHSDLPHALTSSMHDIARSDAADAGGRAGHYEIALCAQGHIAGEESDRLRHGPDHLAEIAGC